MEILKNEFGYEKIYSGFTRLVTLLRQILSPSFLPAVNRLDRLTSGLMILGLSNKTASELSAEFREGNIRKEYIARCKGEFSACVFSCPRYSCLVADSGDYRGTAKRLLATSHF